MGLKLMAMLLSIMCIVQFSEGRTIDEIILAAQQHHTASTARAGSGEDTSYGTLTEYDIMIPRRRAKRSAGSNTRRWPNAEIPYTISADYTESEKSLIEYAIQVFNQFTCIKFIPRNGHTNYVEIISDSGCWSYVGRQYDGRQLLSLRKNGCLYTGTMIHEFAHAAGVIHEQSRSDRDSYVRIIQENIEEGKEHNFRFDTGDNLYGVPYNYKSIMHYGKAFFSKDRSSLNTIETLDPAFQDIIGTSTVFTFEDVKLLSRMYQCEELDITYLGCYEDQATRDLPHYKFFAEANSIEFCLTECEKHGYKFAGLQYSNQCYCGNSFNKYGKKPEEECFWPCSGNSTQICGGFHRNSIYTTALSYLGCYADEDTRDLPYYKDFPTTNSKELCLSECAKQGYKYAGLQYVGQCFCGNSYNRYGQVPETECNIVCPGDSAQRCGGYYKNSIYAIE